MKSLQEQLAALEMSLRNSYAEPPRLHPIGFEPATSNLRSQRYREPKELPAPS